MRYVQLFAIALMSVAAGCSGKGTSAASVEETSARIVPAASQQGLKRCALLTDDEVRDAIGPHGAGTSDVNNHWGLQSCVWTATTARKVAGYPNGWFDTVEVAVFDSVWTSRARKEAKGEPVTGFVKGALYDSSYGDLWFPCARDRFCMVKARTASGKNREQIALRLARLVEKRLR